MDGMQTTSSGTTEDAAAKKPPPKMRRKWRPRLGVILLAVNFVVLLLPLGGIGVLRLYESALVRQTETELIGQAAFVAATFRAELARNLKEGSEWLSYGKEVAPEFAEKNPEHGPWIPRPATLDLAEDKIYPPPPKVFPAPKPADPAAERAGKALTAILADAQRVTLAGIRIVDFNGRIVATTGDDLGGSLAGRDEIDRALRGDNVSMLRRNFPENPNPPLTSISRATSVRVSVAMPILVGDRVLGAVLLVRTPRNIKQALHGKRDALMRWGFGLVLAVILIAVFTAFTVTRPVNQVTRQARRAVAGEKGAVFPVAHPATQEVAELSMAVAQMAETLEERATYIRNFASHVSHEFKTPLASMQGALELMQDHFGEMSADERARFIGNLQKDAGRLEALVRRLLELARAEVMTPGEGEAGHVGDVLRTATERYRSRGIKLSLDVAKDLDGEKYMAAMADETLDSIVSALLENAHQHGVRKDGTPADVSLVARRDGRSVVIDVRDDGQGISGANAGKIFNPFFTTAREDGGTGLGLSVARALVEAHQGALTLESSADTEDGSHFRIRLPLTRATTKQA